LWICQASVGPGSQKLQLSSDHIAVNASVLWRQCLPAALHYALVLDPSEVASVGLHKSAWPVLLLQALAGWSLPALILAGAMLSVVRRPRQSAFIALGLLGVVTICSTDDDEPEAQGLNGAPDGQDRRKPGRLGRGVLKLAERIETLMSSPAVIQGHIISPSVSVGISQFPDEGPDPATLIKNADAAMHRAKSIRHEEAAPSS
jgi:hypothetical protein